LESFIGFLLRDKSDADDYTRRLSGLSFRRLDLDEGDLRTRTSTALEEKTGLAAVEADAERSAPAAVAVGLGADPDLPPRVAVALLEATPDLLRDRLGIRRRLRH
jgi:hypothetical protein